MSKAKPMSQSRRQRRSYEKILKKMDPTSYIEFKKDSMARGKEIHRQNLEDQLRREEELLNPIIEPETNSVNIETDILDVQNKK